MKLELTVDGEQKGVVLCVFIYIHVYAYICVCTYVHGMGSINPPTHTPTLKPLPRKTEQDQVLGDAAEPRARVPPLLGPQGHAPPRGKSIVVFGTSSVVGLSCVEVEHA